MARILYVSHGYCTHDRRFVKQIAGAGHEVLFQPCEALSIQHDLRSPGDSIRFLPPLSQQRIPAGSAAWCDAAGRFRDVVRRLSPDLVHAGPVPTGGFFAAAAEFHPLLVMSWGSDVLLLPEKGMAARRIAEFALKGADIAIADCETVRRRIAMLSGLSKDRIVCLPWGVDLKQFRPKLSTGSLRSRLSWSGCKVVISTRGFESVHQPMVFLGAMKRVLAERKDARVLMLGDGSLKNQVESFIEKNNLSGAFGLAGKVPEEMLPDYFAAADLYVSATPCDGTSVSLLQAMACGLPVVVANGSGNKEWVTHGVNGWLYKPRDSEALAATVLRALSDDEGRVTMGAMNVRIARQRADWSSNFVRVLTAYDRLLASGKTKEARSDVQFQNW